MNAVGQLDAPDCDRRVRKRLEAGHRRAAPLDRSVVLLDDVVQVLVGPHLHVPPARMLAAQKPERAMAWHVAVQRHLARYARERRGERLAKEGLRRRDTAIGAQQEIDGVAMLVHGTIEIVPFGLNRNVGLIHTPGGANRLGEPSPALLQLRDVARNPAEDGGMGNLDPALCHHLHQIAIREPIGDIPSHAQLNDVGVKGALAVHWVTDYRLGHSAPRAVNSAVYPMPRDAPEPHSHKSRNLQSTNSLSYIRHVRMLLSVEYLLDRLLHKGGSHELRRQDSPSIWHLSAGFGVGTRLRSEPDRSE